MKKFLLSLAVAMLVIPVAVIFAGCSGSSVDYDKIKEAVNDATLNVNVNQNNQAEEVNPLLGIWTEEPNHSTASIEDMNLWVFANDGVFMRFSSDSYSEGNWSVTENNIFVSLVTYYKPVIDDEGNDLGEANSDDEGEISGTMTFSNNNNTLTIVGFDEDGTMVCFYPLFRV